MIRTGLQIRACLPALSRCVRLAHTEDRGIWRPHAARAVRLVQRGGVSFSQAADAFSATPTSGPDTGTAGAPLPDDGHLPAAWGFCWDCKVVHSLPKTQRVEHEARRLLETIRSRGGFDFDSGLSMDPKYSLTTKYPSEVKPKAQGQMLGVMIAATQDGSEVVLKAFSGQMNGEWEVGGWVEPIGRMMKDHPIYRIAQRRIEQLGREAADAAAQYADETKALKAVHGRVPQGSARTALRTVDARRLRARAAQRDISRALLARIREEYTLSDFRGRTKPLEEAALPAAQLVGGAGDCAAPKLVAAAQRLNLRPVAVAEFWMGAPPPSGGRTDGEFYTACEERCQPILGFMLCGLDDIHRRATGIGQ